MTLIQFSNDTYIINGLTKTIYYTSGIEYKGQIYHRLPEDFTALPEVYTVLYYTGNDDTNPDMQTADSTGTDTIILRDAPEKEGYEFYGWKIENSDMIYPAGSQYTVTDNTKFIAVWEKILNSAG